MVTRMSGVDAIQKPCRILIIEDDDDDAFLLKRALERARRSLDREIEWDRVDNGLDALYLVACEDLTERLPDALILDLNMPRLDGIGFLKSLRQSLALKNIPVFVLTTTAAPSIHEEAVRSGADRVFVKPNDGEALAAIAREIVAMTMSRASP
jgi:two-component system chemotaxis response regulator CheY